MMTQAWIDRVMSCGLDSPGVVKPNQSEEDDKKDAWTLRYCARFVELGVPLHFALGSYRAMDEPDFTDSPEGAADEEISYWFDDDEGLQPKEAKS